ncbi:MAG: hypothetical protein D6816_07550 [Bacteroidetes bacterium]|nr:MAG: hypothetical protein D6816_07550 [Bacteroidota bacterium]
MKKVNFKNVLMALSLLLVFFFVGTSTASAQQTSSELSSGITAVPQGNFVNADAALQLVEGHLETITEQLKGLPVGTTMYKAVELQYIYFNEINTNLGAGVGVPESIGQSLGAVMTDVNPASKSQLVELKQSAIDLLSN